MADQTPTQNTPDLVSDFESSQGKTAQRTSASAPDLVSDFESSRKTPPASSSSTTYGPHSSPRGFNTTGSRFDDETLYQQAMKAGHATGSTPAFDQAAWDAANRPVSDARPEDKNIRLRVVPREEQMRRADQAFRAYLPPRVPTLRHPTTEETQQELARLSPEYIAATTGGRKATSPRGVFDPASGTWTVQSYKDNPPTVPLDPALRSFEKQPAVREDFPGIVANYDSTQRPSIVESPRDAHGRTPDDPMYGLSTNQAIILQQSRDAIAAREAMIRKGSEIGGNLGENIFSLGGLDKELTGNPKGDETVRGIGRGVGGFAGGLLADPLTYGMAGTGGLLGKVGGRLVAGGFAIYMGKGAYDGARELNDVWNRPDVPYQTKVELTTNLLLNTGMAALSATHAVKPSRLPLDQRLLRQIEALGEQAKQDILSRTQQKIGQFNSQQNPAIATMARAQANAQAGTRVANGQPAIPPQPAPPRPPNLAERFGSTLSGKQIEAIGKDIASLPEEQRDQALHELHDTVTQWISDNNGKVVVNGKVHLAKTPEQAETLAQKLVNEAVDRHDQATAEKQKLQASASAKVDKFLNTSRPQPNTPAASQERPQGEAVEKPTPTPQTPQGQAAVSAAPQIKPAATQEIPPMGRNMTADSPVVQAVQEAPKAQGQEPLVAVKQESPEEMARLAQPPKPVSEAAIEKIGEKDPESGRTILQPTKSPLENDRLAAEAAPELATKLSHVAASVEGAKFARQRPQKNLERVDEKIDHEKPAHTIGDYGAAQISADTPKAKDELIAALKQRFEVVDVEDKFLEGRPDKAGYPSANVQVKLSNGSTAEVQIVPREVQEVTDESHRYYTEGREAPTEAERKELWAKAEKINSEALERFRQRNGIQEGKFKAGSTQVNIDRNSPLGQAHAKAIASIPDEHLMPTDFGGNPKGREDAPHVTLRYGLKDDSPEAVDRIRKAVANIPAFDVPIGKTDAFPPSEHSDGAAPIIARVQTTPELLALRKAIEGAGGFQEDTFPEYKPHVTLAYVRPEVADQYKGGSHLEGQAVPIREIVISKKDGSQEAIPLATAARSAPDLVADFESTDLVGDFEKQQQPAKAEGAQGKPGWPQPGQVGTVPTSELTFAPKRFQYKINTDERGVTGQFVGSKFNPELAGVVSVWHDPADGKLYVVNGHHRGELAIRSGEKDLNVYHLPAKTAEEARTTGAIQNIADGRGTATDAGKLFRETGMTPRDLEKRGISLTEGKISDGLALANLNDFLFEKVATGEMTEQRGVAIGEATADPAQQEAIYKLIQKKEDAGRKITNDTVAELARFVSNSGNKTVEQGGLFGPRQEIHSLALEKAEVSAYIKQQLAKEKRAFGAVASEERASILGRVKDQQIKAKENKEISTAAAQAEEMYNRLSSRTGPVNDILEKAARDQASGNYKPEDIRRIAYSAIRAEISKALGGGEGQGAGRAETASQAEPVRPAEEPVYSVEDERRRGSTGRKVLSDQFANVIEFRPREQSYTTVTQGQVRGRILEFKRPEKPASTAAVQSVISSLQHAQSLEIEHPKAAAEIYRDIIQKNADFQSTVSAYINLGTLFYNERDFPSAITVYSKAVQLDEKNSLAQFNLGNALDETKQWSEAASHYEKAIAASPSWGDPYYNLALLQLRRGNNAKALLAFKGFLKRESTGPWADHARRQVEKLTSRLQVLAFRPSATTTPPEAPAAPAMETVQSKARGKRGTSAPDEQLPLFNPGAGTEEPLYSVERPAPTFFSKAERTAEEKLPKNVSAHSVIATLKNAGVKDEEIKWMGLEDWLKDKTLIPKQQLLDFIRENNVQVKEVTHGTNREVKPIGKAFGVYENGELQRIFSSRDEANARAEEGTTATKYHQWQLPGGENYRELLLTLPKRGEDSAPSWNEISARNEGGNFRSSHFDEPNVLAHVRFNDRVDADGKKVLFLEEVQSDWHQKGRREGYGAELPPGWSARQSSVLGLGNTWEVVDERGNVKNYGNTREGAIRNATNPNAVPNAPFKSTWHELALKRMLRYAAENGYDRVAWTTGEQQAERYNLSKQVNGVVWHQDTGKLFIWEKSNDDYTKQPIATGVTAEKLPDYVGKDVAAKLQSPDAVPERSPNTVREVSGQSLKVESLGMKGFYDNIIPDFLNKYGKKWGAKVGETEVLAHPTDDDSGFNVHSMGITPSMRDSVLYEGQPLFNLSRNDLLNWAKSAGSRIKVEEMGDQQTLFGGNAEKMYRLSTSKQNSVTATEAQLKELAQDVPSLRKKLEAQDIMADDSVRFQYQPPEAATLFGSQKPPILTISRGARDLIASASGSVKFNAANMSVARARLIADKVEPQNWRLAEALREAADDAGHSGITIHKENAAQVAKEEEQFHAGQRQLGKGEVDEHLPEAAMDRVLDHPATEQLRADLKDQGYPELSKAHEVVEMAAHIATGQHSLTPQQAADWFIRYVDELHKEHGEGNIASAFANMYDQARDLYERAKEELTQRAAGQRGSESGIQQPAPNLPEHPTGAAPPETGRGNRQAATGPQGRLDQPFLLNREPEQPVYSRENPPEKDERVLTADGKEAVVQYVHPEMNIARVKVEGEKGTKTLRLATLSPMGARSSQAGFAAMDIPQVIGRALTKFLEPSRETSLMRDTDDRLFVLGKQYEADVLRVIDLMKDMRGVMAPEDWEAIYHHLENTSLPLTEHQQQGLDMVQRIMDTSAQIREKLNGAGIPMGEQTEGYVHRVVQGKSSQIERAVRGGAGTGKGNVLSTSASSLKGRKMFAADPVIEDQRSLPGGTQAQPATNSKVVSIDGGRITGFENGAATDMGASRGVRPGDTFADKQGQLWKLRQATTREIEQHTDLRYYKNALVSAVTDYLQLRRAERAFDALEAMKSDPEFQQMSFKSERGAMAPDGWRRAPAELPQFRDYWFEPHLADAMDRFAKEMHPDPEGALDKIGHLMTNSLVLNPARHIYNIGNHWLVERGASGTFNPLLWPKAAKAGIRAIKAVMTQNEDFVHALDQGTPLMSHRQDLRELNQHIYESLVGYLEQHNDVATTMAKIAGYANQAEMVQALWRVGQRATWMSNDIFFLQSVYEKQARGMSFQDAMQQTAKHIPTYRIPPRVLNSTGLAKVMGSPKLTVFSRYHYGVWKSYWEMAREAAGPQSSLRDRARGLDHMLMLGFLTFVAYKAWDEVLKKVTGDPDARMVRSGASAVPYIASEVIKGNKSPEELIQGTFTPAVLAKTMLEVGFNRDLYTGGRIYDRHGTAGNIATDITQKAVGALGPVQQGEKAGRSETPGRDFLWNLAGVTFPKSESRSQAENLMHDIIREKQMITPERQREMEAKRQRVASGSMTYGERRAELKKQALGELRYYLELPDFSYTDIKKIYAVATPEEKQIIEPIMHKKAMGLLRRNPAEGERVLEEMRQ